MRSLGGLFGLLALRGRTHDALAVRLFAAERRRYSLPPFQELRYFLHPFHHRPSTSFTEYRNFPAGSFYVGFTLALV